MAILGMHEQGAENIDRAKTCHLALTAVSAETKATFPIAAYNRPRLMARQETSGEGAFSPTATNRSAWIFRSPSEATPTATTLILTPVPIVTGTEASRVDRCGAFARMSLRQGSSS